LLEVTEGVSPLMERSIAGIATEFPIEIDGADAAISIFASGTRIPWLATILGATAAITMSAAGALMITPAAAAANEPDSGIDESGANPSKVNYSSGCVLGSVHTP